MMVEGQVRPADVTDPRILAALFELPRERFVSERHAPLAYLDLDLPVGEGRTSRRMLKPMVLAKLLQAADIGRTDRVLDVSPQALEDLGATTDDELLVAFAAPGAALGVVP